MIDDVRVPVHHPSKLTVTCTTKTPLYTWDLQFKNENKGNMEISINLQSADTYRYKYQQLVKGENMNAQYLMKTDEAILQASLQI